MNPIYKQLIFSGSEAYPDSLSTIARNKHDVRPGLFIRGPIPLGWIQEAAKLPGKSLGVGMVLFFLAGVSKSRSDIRLSSLELRKLGISRHSAYRALRKLESARLINVIRKRGRLPVVSIIDNKTKWRF
ncbi:MAG: helix-turn-helix transcriptional regulator [Fibrobacteres bacterium]|nr:helix-turn-helix transcriptional regulator [Fibrobacterota bacterium]